MKAWNDLPVFSREYVLNEMRLLVDRLMSEARFHQALANSPTISSDIERLDTTVSEMQIVAMSRERALLCYAQATWVTSAMAALRFIED